MNRTYQLVSCALLLAFLAPTARAEEKTYWGVSQKIRAEVFANQEVMGNASWLTDVFGPRNAKSPSYLASANWAVEKLKSYGLANAHLEPYRFGIGYVNEYISVHMMEPKYMTILAWPTTWSAGTNGKVRGNARYINFDAITALDDLEPYRGKLKNAVILTNPKQEVTPLFPNLNEHIPKAELDAMAKAKLPAADSERLRRERRPQEDRISRQEIIDFVFAEGAAAIVRTDGRSNYGSVVVENNNYTNDSKPWEKDPTTKPTELVMAAEHYNRIMRILEKDVPVEIELELKVSFSRDDLMDHNVVFEIPGTDLADEIVVLGAHLQANPAGTGAVDDAAGVVAVMEAMRALVAIDAKPRRTIRAGLWGAHEMGTFGNRAHVAKNFADPKSKEYKPGYDKVSCYFNIDIGSGRIRGLGLGGNELLRPILSAWMKPLHAIGMAHIFPEGMQHEAYREVGIPSFYFAQDRRKMDDANAHSNFDTYERLVPEGLIQSSVVMATLAYHAAMRDEILPRIAPLPW